MIARQQRAKILLVLAACALFVGAAQAHLIALGDTPSIRTASAEDALEWLGQFEGPLNQTFMLARDPKEWVQVQREFKLAALLPSLNFATHMVAAVGMGRYPTAGYAVTIVGAEERDGVLYIRYQENSPRPDNLVAQVVTAPFHVKVLPRRNAPRVLFEKVPVGIP